MSTIHPIYDWRDHPSRREHINSMAPRDRMTSNLAVLLWLLLAILLKSL